ncbi:MAG: hypothetical protein ACXW4H_05405, partial [Candidatus Limnocylindrales bacterium]
FRSSVAASLAEVLYLAGKFEDALRYSELAERIADVEDIEAQVKWRMARALALAARGNRDDAMRFANAGVELTAATSDLLLRADALADLGTLRIALGDPEGSGPPWREALRMYDRKGDRVSAGLVRERLAAISTLERLS